VLIGAYARPGLLPPLDSPSQLTGAPLLVLGAAQDDLVTLRWMQCDEASVSVHVEAQAHVFSDDLGCLVELALAGCGVVLAPDYSVRHLLSSGHLVDLLPNWQLPIPEGDTI
jgi:DNA-binding transcriptional LysR family regulator